MRRQRGIYRRKGSGGKLSWHAWVRVDGKPRQRKMGDTYKEAVRELKRARARGGMLPTVTVEQAAILWLETQVSVARQSERDRGIVRRGSQCFSPSSGPSACSTSSAGCST